MRKEEVKKYVSKKVLLILKNNFKYTCIIPNFEGDSFTVKEKFGNTISIDCEMVSLITEIGGTKNDN